MPSAQLNIALLGTGRIAQAHLAPALAKVPDARLWSVLSRDRGRAMGFATRHGAGSPTPAHVTLDALLDDPELDAVLIATPDGVHAAQALEAAAAGKHVLVEKPMATTVESSTAMVDACREAGVTLAVAYHLRWHAGHRLLRESVRAGQFGTLRHVRVQWTWQAADASNWRARPDVGRWWSLGGVGTHCLDFLRWLMVPECGEVESMRSIISRSIWNGPHDETAVAALRFESGATAEMCSSVQFASPTAFEVYGSNGYAIGSGTFGPHGGGTIRTHEGDLSYERTDPYVGEIEDFAAAVRERRPPEVDGKEGLRNVELLARMVE